MDIAAYLDSACAFVDSLFMVGEHLIPLCRTKANRGQFLVVKVYGGEVSGTPSLDFVGSFHLSL